MSSASCKALCKRWLGERSRAGSPLPDLSFELVLAIGCPNLSVIRTLTLPRHSVDLTTDGPWSAQPPGRYSTWGGGGSSVLAYFIISGTWAKEKITVRIRMPGKRNATQISSGWVRQTASFSAARARKNKIGRA